MSKLDNIIDGASNQFASAIERVQLALVNQVLDLKNQGYTKGEIIRVLDGIDIESFILNDLNLSGDIEKLSGVYTKVLENLNGFGAVTEESLQALVNIDKSYFLGESKNLANTLKQQLARGVIAGATENELKQGILEGFGGVLRSDQAKTLANTSLNSYSRQVTELMAESMPEDTKYYYQGVVDERTRDICLDMVGAGEMTKAEIDSAYPSTFTDGGGFNCRHRWTMVTSQVKLDDKKAKKFIDKKPSFNPVTARGVQV